MPAYTAFRALEFISQLIAIIVGVSCFEDFFKAEKAVLILGLLVALLGLAGTAKLWNFTTLKTNQYAASASMVLCYCFAEMPQAVGRRRRTLIVFGLISFPIIAVGLCATTNVATFVGLLSGAALTRSRTALIFAVVLLAVVLILVPGLTANFLEMTKDILFPGKTDAQIRGLHGRVSMWESQLALGKTSPYIGHGFAVQSRLQGTISSHNAFVQVFLDTGIIGILVFSISLLMLVGGVVKRWKTVSIGLPGCAAVFICVFVHLLSLVLIGAQWLAPSFTFAAFAGLYVNHIHGVTNYRLPHSELEYERCLGYKIVS
jgi:O-antigen ligase